MAGGIGIEEGRGRESGGDLGENSRDIPSGGGSTSRAAPHIAEGGEEPAVLSLQGCRPLLHRIELSRRGRLSPRNKRGAWLAALLQSEYLLV
jgi:hypothetical protein